jgi:tetratricopeptide (TPR) repeat protein
MSDPLNPVNLPQQMAALVAPVFTLAEDWQTVTQPPTTGFPRTQAVLSATERVVGRKRLASLRSAVAAKDPRALAAVEMLSTKLKQVAEMARFVCVKLRDSGRFQDMLAEAELLLLYSEAAGQGDLVIDALWLRAVALRALQDAQGAIAAYRGVLAVASPHNKKVRSAALDNLANILTEVGEYDEALTCYRESENEAANPHERFSILLNRARLRHSLGDLSGARADLEASKALLKQVEGAPTEWGIVYDFDAQLTQLEGRAESGLALALKAQTALKDAPPRDRAINAMIRAGLHNRLEQRAAAAAAFDEALGLAEQAEGSAINKAFYRSGFAAALKKQLPLSDEVYKQLGTALALDSQGMPQQSQEYFTAALNRARQHGDVLTGLRVEMNWAAQLQRVGQVARAGAMANDVRQQALRYGLAYAEAGVIVTLSSLSDDGSDRAFNSLFGYARAKLLLSLHNKIVGELKLDAPTAAYETADNGTLENQLGKLAERVGAYETAATFARVSVEKAMRAAPFEWITSNRLAGLLHLYRKLKRANEAEAITERIRSLLADNRLTPRARLIASRAIGDEKMKVAPEQAERSFKAAIDAAEDIRSNIADFSERAVVDRQYRDIYPKYAMLLRKAGKVATAYEALQLGRGRAFLDAARGGDDKPATLAEIQAALPAGETLVEFVVEENGLAAYLVTSSSLDVISAEGDVHALEAADLGDMRERAAKLLEICRHSPLILDLVAGVAQRISVGGRVLLVPDIGLHNLPLHVTPVESKPWCERASIAYLPGSAFLLLARAKTKGGSVFVAGNSRGDLPGADAECDEVGVLYGVSPLKKGECTQAALEKVLEKGPIDVVHLAVHGRGNPRRGSQSSLMFATENGGTELVDLEALAERPWPAKLVVLSGCSTGLGGLRDGRELVSVAGRILQSGANAVVASLWSVGDENARIVMRTFHTALKGAQPDAKDYRIALDVARAALTAGNAPITGKIRDGRDIRPEDAPPDPAWAESSMDLDWASFVVVGDPCA